MSPSHSQRIHYKLFYKNTSTILSLLDTASSISQTLFHPLSLPIHKKTCKTSTKSQIDEAPSLSLLPQVVELHNLGHGSMGQTKAFDGVEIFAICAQTAFEGVTLGFRPRTHARRRLHDQRRHFRFHGTDSRRRTVVWNKQE